MTLKDVIAELNSTNALRLSQENMELKREVEELREEIALLKIEVLGKNFRR